MDLYDNKNIKPMLLYEVDKPFNDKNYLYEIKFDGIRALIFVDSKNILIVNRRGNILNDVFPELSSIKKQIKNKCIFDGEIIVMLDGKQSFKKLQERAHLKNKNKIDSKMKECPVTFVCFDIIYENKDLTNIPLLERKKILVKYKDTNIFIKTKYFLENGIDLFNSVKKLNLEGIIAKKINSKYHLNKRSKDWLKIKNQKDDDFYIGGYKIEDNEGSLASILLGEKINNELIYVGSVTIGKNNPEFHLIQKCKKLKECAFKNNEKEGYVFIEPKYICSVHYIERTSTNSLRQPIFKGLRLDK